jgi:hypothetical protein
LNALLFPTGQDLQPEAPSLRDRLSAPAEFEANLAAQKKEAAAAQLSV